MGEEFDNSQDQNGITANNFRLSLQKYAYQTPTLARKADPTAPSGSSQADTPAKRQNETTDGGSPAKRPKKKRGYAPPETYSHLSYLTDCLGMYLEGSWPACEQLSCILICFLNSLILWYKVSCRSLILNFRLDHSTLSPGVLSAKVGHHFAHPTNQFYKILHGAGENHNVNLLRPCLVCE